MVAEAVEINIPFNNPVTGFCAFTHKAGIHAKAILNNPSTYEIINPADFGMTRYVHFASRLTGWNAIKSRVEQLGLHMTDEQIKIWYVLMAEKITGFRASPFQVLSETSQALTHMMQHGQDQGYG